MREPTDLPDPSLIDPPVASNGRPPSVDALARSLTGTGLPHPLLVDAARHAIAAGDPELASREAAVLARTLLQPVVNATGVLLHTNLGRAPLATRQEAAYSNLELDLGSGTRGSRSAHAATLLARAAGAEAGLVVNNGAAAVLLVLAALARRRQVVVSRGELVEIGGGFRIPDVMAESGARLVEVGTTNRTRRADYEAALSATDSDVALVMKVHQSNYRIEGFTETVGVDALAELGPPVVVDLGSGLLDASCSWLAGGPPDWLVHEPAARQTLAAGADLVIFSGDKLLGGPQAGVVLGRSDLVDRCAAHPLARALRPGGLLLGALQQVALSYLDRTASSLPFWHMATTPVGALHQRADAIIAALASGGKGPVPTAVACESVTGGGTLPGVVIASAGVAIEGDQRPGLRAHAPPVIARTRGEQTLLDLRTVDPDEDETLIHAITSAAATRASRP